MQFGIRGAALLVATIALAATAVAAVIYIDQTENLIVSVVANALSIPVVALLTYLYFTSGRDRIAERRYRARAANPDSKTGPSSTGSPYVVARPKLIEELVREVRLSPNGSLLVVTGPAGSGKTTFLHTLMANLAENRLTPIPFRAEIHYNFSQLGSTLEASFVAAFNRHVGSAVDAHRVWRRVCQSNRVVVLVDGLDDWRGRMGMTSSEALTALHLQAREHPFKFVAAVRSDGLDFSSVYPTFALDPLNIGDADRNRVLSASPLAIDNRTRDIWRDALTALDAARSPLFMTLALDLVAHPADLESISSLSGEEAQYALLNSWTNLQIRQFSSQYPVDPEQLRRSLTMLSRIAFVLSFQGRLEASTEELRQMLERQPALGTANTRWGEISNCYQLGRGIGMLHTQDVQNEPVQRFQFRHSILQVYLAAVYIRQNAVGLGTTDFGTLSAELTQAIVIYLREGDTIETQHLRERGVTYLENEGASRYLWLTVLSSLPTLTSESRAALLQAYGDQFSSGNDVRKIQLIDQLIQSDLGDAKYEALWSWVTQRNYSIGIAAAEALAKGGSESLAVLTSRIELLLRRNEGRWLYNVDDWATNGGIVTVLATVIPLWREHCSVAADRITLTDWARILLELVRVGQLGGVEASVVSGYRKALAYGASSVVWTEVDELQQMIKSYVAKLPLLHAIATHGEHAPPTYLWRVKVQQFADETEHPFVRESARLVLNGKSSRGDAIWRPGEHNEPKTGSRLAQTAHQLASDVYLMNTLADQGGGSPSELGRRQDAWLSRDLPWCIAGSPDRRQLFDGCASQCGFNLCPIDLNLIVLRRAAPLSEAFSSRAEELSLSSRRQWSPNFYGPQAAAFWRRLRAAMQLLEGRSRYDDWDDIIS